MSHYNPPRPCLPSFPPPSSSLPFHARPEPRHVPKALLMQGLRHSAWRPAMAMQTLSCVARADRCGQAKLMKVTDGNRSDHLSVQWMTLRTLRLHLYKDQLSVHWTAFLGESTMHGVLFPGRPCAHINSTRAKKPNAGSEIELLEATKHMTRQNRIGNKQIMSW